MKQEESKAKVRQQKVRQLVEEHLNSPLALLIRLRKLVFGNKEPDMFTKIAFYIGLLTWVIFFFWHVLQFIVLKNSNWIEAIKQLPISELLNKRAQALGFESAVFIDRLLISYSISIISWSLFFVGLILMWRKQRIFSYFIFTALGVAMLSPIMLLGFSYWSNDISSFDKIYQIIITLFLVIYSYLTKLSIEAKKPTI